MSVASAYRRDAAAGRIRENEFERAWLAVASLIEQASEAAGATQKDLVTAAAHLAVKSLGAARVRAEARAEWGRAADGNGEIVFLFGLAVETASLLELADSIAACATRIEVFSPLERARFAALRARIARKLDRPDFAEDGYRAAWRLGRKLGDSELQARAALGLSSLAQLRGNYPAMLAQSRRVIRLARKAGTPRLEHEGHIGVVVVMAMRKEFGRAIDAAWAMLRCARFNRAQELRDLAVLGKLLIEMQRHAEAAKVLVRIVSTPSPPDAVVPALGSLAVAAASTHDDKMLNWALDQIDALRTAVAPRYEYASTLLDAAAALVCVGRTTEAATYHGDALRIAAKYGFHELVIRGEALPMIAPVRVIAPAALRGAGAHVLRSINRWRLGPLPRRTRMASPLTAR